MKEFIKQMLSGASDISSKRTCGVYLILVATVQSFFKLDLGVIQTFLITGATLLGLGLFELNNRLSK